jgi:hypothetical protein
MGPRKSKKAGMARHRREGRCKRLAACTLTVAEFWLFDKGFARPGRNSSGGFDVMRGKPAWGILTAIRISPTLPTDYTVGALSVDMIGLDFAAQVWWFSSFS